MKKETVFLALLTTVLTIPSTLSGTYPVTPVLASEGNKSDDQKIDLDAANISVYPDQQQYTGLPIGIPNILIRNEKELTENGKKTLIPTDYGTAVKDDKKIVEVGKYGIYIYARSHNTNCIGECNPATFTVTPRNFNTLKLELAEIPSSFDPKNPEKAPVISLIRDKDTEQALDLYPDVDYTISYTLILEDDTEKAPTELNGALPKYGKITLTAKGNHCVEGSQVSKIFRFGHVEEDIIDFGNFGTALWTLNDDGVLTVGSGSYTQKPEYDFFWGMDLPWWDYRNQIKHIDGTAPFIATGSYAELFDHLDNLETVDLSGWDISKVTSLSRMFEECKKLKSINIANWDTSNVTNMEAMFLLCESLETLDIANWKTSKVTNLGGMFEHCHKLKSIDLSQWDTSKVERMTYLFDRCYALESLNISNWNTSSLKEMGWMFRELPVTSLDLANWDTSKVKVMDGVFYLCTQLETLDISNWDTSSVVESDEDRFRGKEFTDCNSLKEIKYSQSCESLLSKLPNTWYLNDEGPYSGTEIPKLSQGQKGLLTRDKSQIEPTPSANSFSLTVSLSLQLPNVSENRLLTQDEVVKLSTEINQNYNPNSYNFQIEEASVSQEENSLTFTMTLNVKLKDDSKINLIFKNLKKKFRSEDAFINFETVEESSYFIEEIDDQVIIKGLKVDEAFNNQNRINSPAIKNILEEAGYDVGELNFSSYQNKNSSFVLKNLETPITIEVLATGPSQGVHSSGSSSKKSSSQPVQSPISTVKKALYRFYNKLTGEHFFTANEEERNQLLTDNSWTDESQGWTAPSISDFPVYRLLNPNNGDHHYTTDKNEYTTLQTLGWKDEGIAFYSADTENEDYILLHRLYNPNAKDAGSHHYTVDSNERDELISQGWTYEGTAWAGLPTEK